MRYNPNVVLVKEPRNILYDVMPPLGVYIQHIDGSLYTTDEWTANGFANFGKLQRILKHPIRLQNRSSR